MKVAIIKIGNSKGIILSKTMMERYGFKDQAEIIMKPDALELKPVNLPRLGWDEAFLKMHGRGDDKMLDQDVLDDDLPEEWK
jgi:antitoxin MazE